MGSEKVEAKVDERSHWWLDSTGTKMYEIAVL